MKIEWKCWSDYSERVELHGLTPSFADAIGKQNKAPFEDGMLNVRPDPLDYRDRYYNAPLIGLPVRLCAPELGDLDLHVRDQGAEGSCTGQALAAVIDLQNARRRLDTYKEDKDLPIPIQVSARMLYKSARSNDEYAEDGLPGSSVRGAIKGFFHNGVCDAQSAPYFPGDLEWRLTAELSKEARGTSLGSYYRLRHVINDYHAALTEVGAVLCSAMVHEGWKEEKVRRASGRIRMAPPRSLRLMGAHAFALVGYDRDGFYVLNSWGDNWGGLKVAVRDGKATRQPGIALWPYEDWQKHVLDAWVLRLSAPFAKTFAMIGGFVHSQARLTDPASTSEVRPVARSVSAQEIIGHYVQLDDGDFVTTGAYPSSAESVAETARYLLGMDDLPQASKRYDRVLIYAHGGLNNLTEAAARMAAMTPGFKRNGVYPIFFLWRTGLLETIGDVLRGPADRALLRAGGAQDFLDRLIEEAAQLIGRPIWTDMKDDTDRSFSRPPRGGRQAMKVLTDALTQRAKHPVTCHYVGHSAGTIFLGRLFDQLDPAARALTGTVSLMAPACTVDLFNQSLDPIAAALPNSAEHCTRFILSDKAEREDRVAAYHNSLLYLISNGLEGRRETPIAGMQKFASASPPRWTTFVASSASAQSRASTHGGFDNDATTMNTILTRVCGRKINEANGGFTQAELSF